jgi:8-oxo-dGTP pyrophosphatase MutT (NUDIX family)
MTFDLEQLRRRLMPVASGANSDYGQGAEAAVAVILNPVLNEGSMLLMQRMERAGDPWSGQVAFPGGHRSVTDRTHVETAIREASEEVGIDLSEDELLGGLPFMYSRGRRVLVAPLVFKLLHEASVRLNQEVATSFWIPLDALSTMRVTRRDVRDEGLKLTVDSYVYDNRVIWGLTFRIINALLNRNEPTA